MDDISCGVSLIFGKNWTALEQSFSLSIGPPGEPLAFPCGGIFCKSNEKLMIKFYYVSMKYIITREASNISFIVSSQNFEKVCNIFSSLEVKKDRLLVYTELRCVDMTSSSLKTCLLLALK